MTQAVKPVSELCLEFAIPHTEPQSYPVIQPDDYQPKLGSPVRLLLNGKSVAKSLDDDAIALLDLKPTTVEYAGGSAEMYEFSADTRWVILAHPKTFIRMKDSKDRPVQNGSVEWVDGMETVAKVLLAAVVNGSVVLAENGTPQIFTLNLTSRSGEFIVNKNNPEHRTIVRMNAGLQKHWKASGQWLTHLVSVGIEAFAEKRAKKTDPKLASNATGYRLVGDAVILPKEQQAAMFHLVQSIDFIELAKNPFARSGDVLPESNTSDGHPGYAEDDIEF